MDLRPVVARTDISFNAAAAKWTADSSLSESPNWWHDTDDPNGAPPGDVQGGMSVACEAAHTIMNATVYKPGLPACGTSDAESIIQNVTLLAIQKFSNTDMAMLQKRDFYNVKSLSTASIAAPEFKNQIDRIVWIGDFAITLHVTGKTIRAILAQSKLFDQSDRSAIDAERVIGRGIIKLGLDQDSTDPDVWYVNGVKMDDAALYTIATSEFLALGDTGYSGLATPDFPPPMRLKDFKSLKSISAIVCQYVHTSDVSCYESNVDGKGYFDVSTNKAFDKTPGLTAASRYQSFFKRLTLPPSRSAKPVLANADAEGSIQQRPFWSLNLEKADLSYSGTYIDHISSAQTNLAHTGQSAVTTTPTNSLAADWSLRFVRDYKPATFYLLSDANYQRTDSLGKPASITNNIKGFETGATVRLAHLLQRRSWLAAQFAVRYEGQFRALGNVFVPPSSAGPGLSVATQIAVLNANAAVTEPPGTPPLFVSQLNLPIPETSTIFYRAGLRVTHDDTFLEFGYEKASSRGLIKNYVFNASGVAYTCSPSAAASPYTGTSSAAPASSPVGIDQILQLFANTTAAPSLAQSTYLTGGLYLNFNLKFLIWSRQDSTKADQSWYFTLANKGDLYFNNGNDTPVQTRILNKLSPGLQFPIYGKFTLTPKMDFIYYENKVAHSVYRAFAPSLSLSYTFALRGGMGAHQAIRYGEIITPQTPPK